MRRFPALLPGQVRSHSPTQKSSCRCSGSEHGLGRPADRGVLVSGDETAKCHHNQDQPQAIFGYHCSPRFVRRANLTAIRRAESQTVAIPAKPHRFGAVWYTFMFDPQADGSVVSQPVPGLAPFLAGIVGGALNAVAGGGSFVAFPTLLLTGVPPIPANATNTLALWTGVTASGGAYRNRLDVPRRVLIPLLIASFIGGIRRGISASQDARSYFYASRPGSCWALRFFSCLENSWQESAPQA